jgi:sortase A
MTASLRRVEILLWLAGISLLGVVVATTYARWSYQVQQERALFQRGSADSLPTKAAEEFGPVNPPRAAVESTAVKAKRHVADPAALGRLEIPRLGLKAIVRKGADEKTLARAVGLVPGSARPGDPGNIVLAGHRDTLFWPLREIEVNDRIRVVVPPHTYEYRVQSVRVVTPDETSVLQSRGVEELTLVTCYPFSFVGAAPERFIVSAARVN